MYSVGRPKLLVLISLIITLQLLQQINLSKELLKTTTLVLVTPINKIPNSMYRLQRKAIKIVLALLGSEANSMNRGRLI